jgi:hypothetical protein
LVLFFGDQSDKVFGTHSVGMYVIFGFFERRMTAWSVRGGDALAQTIGG